MLNKNLQAMRELVQRAAHCFVKGLNEEVPCETARSIADQVVGTLKYSTDLVVLPRAPSRAMIHAARTVLRADPASRPETIWAVMLMAAEADPAA